MPATHHLTREHGNIAYDDTGGDGPPLVLLPGAGDVRSEYRFLAERLIEDGHRVVTMDLRGHGESSCEWPSHTMVDTAGDLIALLEHLATGPAVVVATSFAPTAALWAAVDRPELVAGLVLVSAHLDAAPAWQNAALRLLLSGPLAGRMWASQYAKWHPAAAPADLDAHLDTLRSMLSNPQRRAAVRETLTANRDGLATRLDDLTRPALVVMGGGDSHFNDPHAEGATIARRTSGTLHMIPDAGHYPHVEFPEQVHRAISDFLEGIAE